jgi:hypothetical protein
MDAFWYAPDGGYRTWRQPHWPQGPDRWLKACLESGVKPGLWIATNALSKLAPAAAWQDSLNRRGSALCLFRGGFLADMMDALQGWYERGVRMFKLDFADLSAATPDAEATHLPEEIQALNAAALRSALVAFRRHNPEVRFLAYNGFGGDQGNTSLPFRKTVDLRWLDAFDSLYCGDPRPADVPAVNFWRSKDIYSDQMVFQYERNGVPLERIDNTSFMVGVTGTCYKRRTAAWQGMLMLSLARGGWMNTYYGNLELLDDQKAAWFARAQRLFLPMQALGRTFTFGGMPGEGVPYGYVAANERGMLYTVVNPSQDVSQMRLPQVSPYQPAATGGRLLFSDAGFRPVLEGDRLTLGPEQMATIGYGELGDAQYDLGTQEDTVIPQAVRRLAAQFEPSGHNQISASILPPPGGDLRIVMTQSDRNGIAHRSTGGSPPAGRTLGNILRLAAEQDGRALPVTIQYDKAIWSGLSWASGEVERAQMQPDRPLRISCSSSEPQALTLAAELYQVSY